MMTCLSDALTSLQAGDIGEAERLSNLALMDDEARPDALHILGLAALARGEEAIALRRIREAVAADPDNLDRRLNLGQMELDAGDVSRAITTFESLSQCTSGAAAVQLALSSAYRRAERYQDAIQACERAVEAAPDVAQCWSDLAQCYMASGEAAAAAEGYRYATQLTPDEPESYFNLGIAELHASHPELARTAFDACLSRDPDHIKARVNLGIALKELGLPQRALEVQREAVAFAPDDADAQWNLALTELSLGDYEQGFARYEARTKLPGYPVLPGIPWDGTPSPAASLVLHTEQGIGDTLMLLRFVAGARARVRHVVLAVPGRLVQLLEESFAGADEIIANDAEPRSWPAETLHARLPSLPHLLRVGSDFAVEDAYLSASPDRGAAVSALMADFDRGAESEARTPTGLKSPEFTGGSTAMTGPSLLDDALASPRHAEAPLAALAPRVSSTLHTGRRSSTAAPFRVGLAWQGNPGYRADHQRSIPLASLAPLAEVPGVRLFALQKYEGVEQLQTLPDGFNITDLGAKLDADGHAFVDTAAALNELDLLVTSDSAIAHLAGALGVETWLLLARVPDFRWGIAGNKTPWYASVRLFRQSSAGDWATVAASVAQALRERSQHAR